MNIDLSIIIVNYNLEKYLVKCIRSIKKYIKNINYEIIVVDNKSDGKSINFLKLKFASSIKLIKNDKNYGFGKACNIGVKKSKGEYLLFLNPDSEIKNDIVKNYLVFMNLFKIKIGVVGANLKNTNGYITHSFGLFPSIINDFVTTLFNIEKNIRKKRKGYFFVDYVTGACMFIKKEVFNIIGGFDEYFFLYFEETDLQYRLHKSGYKNVILNGAEIIHHGSKSFRTNEQKNKYFFSSKLKYFRKHLSIRKYFISNLIVIFITIIKLPIDIICINHKKLLIHIDTIKSFINGLFIKRFKDV